MSSPSGSPARLAPYRWAASALGLAGAVVLLDPDRTHVPLCPLHAATGLYCPLCGGLRSVYALLHGQLGIAVRDNALLVSAVPFVLWWWLDWRVRARANRRAGRPSRRLTVVLVVLALAFTVIRNLPIGSGLRPS